MSGRSSAALVVVGLLVTLVLAGVVSSWASDSPDGLEKVAAETGMDAEAREPGADAAFSDYRADGLADERWAKAVAGIAGVGVTFAVFGGLTWVLRRRRPAPAGPARE
jgi:hypothetical protein